MLVHGHIHGCVDTKVRRPRRITDGPGQLRSEGREEVEDSGRHQRHVVRNDRPRCDHLAVADTCQCVNILESEIT